MLFSTLMCVCFYVLEESHHENKEKLVLKQKVMLKTYIHKDFNKSNSNVETVDCWDDSFINFLSSDTSLYQLANGDTVRIALFTGKTE